MLDNVEIDSDVHLLTYSARPVLDYYKDSGILLAAAITALGRIKLYKDICSVLEHGGKVAYCDTDSIFAEFEQSPLGD